MKQGFPALFRAFCAFGALTLLLSGCGASDEDDLRRWTAEQRAQTRPRIEPINPPKQFLPQGYEQAAAADPFEMQKLAKALRRESRSANNDLVAPELQRRKEPLEAYPLDTMRMVGSLTKAGQLVALVQANNLLYQVRPGEHLGQNFGRVTRITESGMTLREVVQDATGDWVERAAALELQEMK
ncbi:MAG: pilus assembly protein PilP [Xylophilus ampelinus]